MNINTEALKELFDKRIIPEKEAKPLTFLEIAKQPHYEDVISNIYAFFFDEEQEHGFNDLFVKSLIDCINKKIEIKLNPVGKYDVSTQVDADKAFIDILLKSESSAIVIENKIYHHLSNPLNKYWKKATENLDSIDNSIGVVLSLGKVEVDNNNFINVTHKDLMNQVNVNLGNYYLSSNPKYLTYLQDFQQNLFNLYSKIMNEEQLRIYLENKDQIEDAITLKDEYKIHTHRQIKALEKHTINKENLFHLDTKYPKSRSGEAGNLTFFLSEKNDVIRLSVSYRNLWNKRGFFRIRIGLRSQKEENKYRELSNKFEVDTPELNDKEKGDKVIFIKDYKPSVEEKMNLTEYVATKLKDDGFLELFKKIDSHLLKQ